MDLESAKLFVFATLGLILLSGCCSWTWNGTYSDPFDTSVEELDIKLQQQEKEENIVKYYFVVEDDSGKTMGQFKKGNFKLKYQGEEIPFNLEYARNLPVKVVLVIDRSNSMIWDASSSELPVDEQPLTFAKAAAKNFVGNMKAGDEAAVIAFAGSVSTVCNFTSSKQTLYDKIDSIGAEGYTAVYDAIYKGLELTETKSGRKAIVALTDGSDNSSYHSKSGVLSFADELSIPIYTIGYSCMGGTMYEKDLLMDIANKTNARFYESATAGELSEVYSSISASIGNQYLLSFALPEGADPEDVSLEVNYQNANGLITDTVQLK